MTQTAGIANLVNPTFERTTGSFGNETCIKTKSGTQNKIDKPLEPSGSVANEKTVSHDSSSNPFTNLLSKKIKENQTTPQKDSSSKKQENLQTEIPADAAASLLASSIMNLPSAKTKKEIPPVQINQQPLTKKSPSLPILPKTPSKKSPLIPTSKSPKMTQVEKTTLDKSQPETTTFVKNPEKTIFVKSKENKNEKTTEQVQSPSGSNPKVPQPENPHRSSEKPDLLLQAPLKDGVSSVQQKPSPQSLPITIPFNPPTTPIMRTEKTDSEQVLPEIQTKSRLKSLKTKNTLESPPSSDSHTKEKDRLGLDLSAPAANLSRVQPNAESHQGLRSPTTVHSLSTAESSSSELEAPLSVPQQVLRSLQSAIQNDHQTIQLALSPEGLGLVRIKLDRTGEEISGVLEIQKEQTRQEIEKALPNLVASLNSQGIQVRKIEISQTPNQEFKFSSSDNPGDWNLRYEMQGEQHQRSQGTDTYSAFSSESVETKTTLEEDGVYPIHPDSKVLNLFI
jgi:flagellar hook-length control protein FliK